MIFTKEQLEEMLNTCMAIERQVKSTLEMNTVARQRILNKVEQLKIVIEYAISIS